VIAQCTHITGEEGGRCFGGLIIVRVLLTRGWGVNKASSCPARIVSLGRVNPRHNQDKIEGIPLKTFLFHP